MGVVYRDHSWAFSEESIVLVAVVVVVINVHCWLVFRFAALLIAIGSLFL